VPGCRGGAGRAGARSCATCRTASEPLGLAAGRPQAHRHSSQPAPPATPATAAAPAATAAPRSRCVSPPPRPSCATGAAPLRNSRDGLSDARGRGPSRPAPVRGVECCAACTNLRRQLRGRAGGHRGAPRGCARASGFRSPSAPPFFSPTRSPPPTCSARRARRSAGTDSCVRTRANARSLHSSP
jgi:hypothetical protein